MDEYDRFIQYCVDQEVARADDDAAQEQYIEDRVIEDLSEEMLGVRLNVNDIRSLASDVRDALELFASAAENMQRVIGRSRELGVNPPPVADLLVDTVRMSVQILSGGEVQ